MTIKVKTTISVLVFEDAEGWIRKYVPMFHADSVACVRPTTRFDPDGLTEYEDVEENTKKKCSMADHVRALRQMCEEVGFTLFVGGVKSPRDLLDAGNWDVEVVDAYYQFVMNGKVLYG